MEKKIITKEIFYECRRCSDWSDHSYKWGEVKESLAKGGIELQDDDYLRIHLEEGYDHGDSARDDFYAISVHRDVWETDEEFNKRKKRSELSKIENQKKRYENYLKLKEEFENSTE